MKKRQKGRPRKKKGSIESRQFARAASVLCAYEDARENGEKHIFAVKHAVALFRHCTPGMPISETGVKRILSTFRPRGRENILRFERSTLSKEDLRTNREMRKQFATLRGKKGITLVAPPSYDATRSVATFKFGIAKRPDYPRCNHKAPNE
jgi:hypothetical protein